MNNLEDMPPEVVEPVLEFPVVGIGASAGGLEALIEMFHHASGDTGMAFVLVLHLDPNHESLMAELLSRKTDLNVRQIADGDALEPNQLHIIPPGSGLRLDGGRLRLEEFEEPRGLRRPIDSFFFSLAKSQGARAASVILSGTGADGAAGMRSIKEMGGICVAQIPDEARYDGMPFAALATEMVDYTLPAHSIVERIQSYFSGNVYPKLSNDSDTAETALSQMFRTLRDEVGHDFSGYKRATIFRRLERRLQVLEYDDIEDYLAFLNENVEEQRALFQDFLINVTSFFRDADSFDQLQESVIEPLVNKSLMADEIRIWVPGCSSGQEAYSIAMLVDEACKKMQKRPLVQIFATDIDETVIHAARRGQFPASALSELPKRFQVAYTIGQDGQFEIVPKIRDMVRFSLHSVIKDAPFSKIDLISCRNLLIYLDEKLQNDLLPIFHFALRDDGYLFLGNSENVTRRGELFDTVDGRARIFMKRKTAKLGHIMLPLGAHSASRPGSGTAMSPERDFPRQQRMDVSNAVIYEQYAPPFVRVASDGRIVDSSGDLSLFLMSRPGDERHIFALARDGIRDIIMPLMAEALKEGKRLAQTDVEISSPFGIQKADLIAHPMKDGTIALIFNAKGRLSQEAEEFAVTPSTNDQRIADLQEDLQGTRLLLKSKVEEVETTNEELKSSNEEMMSMNEELQSANEELTTANEELKNKNDQLSVANTDLDNFMQSSDLMMVVVDRAYRIRHLTESAKRVLPFRSVDRGRAITEFRIELKGVDLPRAISDVFETSEPFEQSTMTSDGERQYLLRITPYFHADTTIEGATITLVDLTELKTLQDDLRVESERLKLAMSAGRMGHADLDVESGKITIDETLAEQLGLEKAGDVTLKELSKNIDDEHIPKIEDALKSAIDRGERYEVDFRVVVPGQDERWIRTRGLQHRTPDGRLHVIGPTVDITMERHELLVQEMSHRIKNLFAVISSIASSTPKESPEVEAYAEELQSRINALSLGYDLARKQGNLDGVNWIEFLETILSPNCTTQTLELTGPDTYISSRILTALTLLVHELATNALKYGAFSSPEGTLKLNWSISEDRELDVHWIEYTPNFKPSEHKDGFGSRLVKLATQQLQGNVEQSMTTTGLYVRLKFTLP